MRYLVILPYLFWIVGCLEQPKEVEHLSRFHFGDKVIVWSGFYKGSTGRIISCFYGGYNDVMICEVDSELTSYDGQYKVNSIRRFNETQLLLDERE